MAERCEWEIAAEYSDEAASAWTGDRGPELARALDHAEALAPCALVVQHSDRLARGDGRQARHLAEIYFWAIKADVEIHSVQDDSTFSNPILAVALGERNAEDSRRKSLAVKAGMKRRAERGLFTGPRPFGYEYAADGSGLVIAIHEAEIVRRIYAEFVGGRSLSAVTRELHRDGIHTATGARWRQSTVSGILSNPVYTGHIRHLGVTIEAHHEPIIDQDLWNRAASRLTTRRSLGRGRPTKGPHLFRAGLLRCECGDSMVPRTRDEWEFYYCNGRSKLGPEFCTMSTIDRVKVDGAVYRYFEQIGLDVQATRKSLSESLERRLAEIRAVRGQAAHEAQLAADRLTRVRRDYQDGAITAADWAEQRDQLSAERKAATAEAERLAASLDELERDGGLVDVERELLGLLVELRDAIDGKGESSTGVDSVRATLGRLFECFVLHHSPPERVHVELAGPGMWIEPIIRGDAIAGFSESMRPLLHREPLADLGKNDVKGPRDLVSFKPILVGA